jgi:hypothetical protein
MENYPVCRWTQRNLGSIPAYSDEIPAFEGDYVLKISNPTFLPKSARVTFGSFKGKVGFELRWYKPTDDFDFILGVVRQSPFIVGGGIEQTAEVRYVHGPEAVAGWYYLSSFVPVQYARIPNANVLSGGFSGYAAWHYLKVVLNFDKRIYSRLVTNYLDLPLEPLNLPILSNPLVGTAGMCLFYVRGDMANITDNLYIDDARIYLNEV